mgnify:CR=1 FL=1
MVFSFLCFYAPVTIISFVFGFTRLGIWMILSPLLCSWYHHAWIVFKDVHYSGIKKYFHLVCSISITIDLFLFTFDYMIAGFSLGFIVLMAAILQRIGVMRRHTNIVEKVETCTTIVPLSLLLLLGLSMITMFIDSKARL